MKIIILSAIATVLIFLCAGIICHFLSKIIKYFANELEKMQRFL